MTLKETITEHMKDAMRSKDSTRLGTIRMLLAACKQIEVDERKVLSDDEVIKIVDKLIKQRKDSVTAYTSANRLDLAAQEESEIAVLAAYLPARLSLEEIEKEVANIVAEIKPSGPSDMGKVMQEAKTRLASKAEMALVSQAIKTALASI